MAIVSITKGDGKGALQRISNPDAAHLKSFGQDIPSMIFSILFLCASSKSPPVQEGSTKLRAESREKQLWNCRR